MPAVLSAGNCQYTPLITAGTTTLNPGPLVGPPSQPGVLYGAQMLSAGTGFGVTFVDIIPASPGGAVASTNTLMNGTSTAGGAFIGPGPTGLGVRYRGALVAITTGTPGAYNALWD